MNFRDWKETVKRIVGEGAFYTIPDDNTLIVWYEKGWTPQQAVNEIERGHYTFYEDF